MKKKNILVITTARSDYDLLYPIIKSPKKNINFKLLVTGNHFSKSSDFSYKKILKDNLKIDFKIKTNLYDKIDISVKFIISEIISKLVLTLSKTKLKFNYVIILGDRFEAFACAVAAFSSGLDIIHISGGEKTKGSKDDVYRHCISKLSKIHFVAHKDYKKRLIQLGEQKKDIYIVGGTGPENIQKIKFKSKKAIQNEFHIKLKKNIIMFTYYPDLTFSQKKNKNY